MKFFAYGQTDTGVTRTHNEDSLCVEDELGLFIVADGIGGSAAGEIASTMAVDVIREHIRKTLSNKEAFIGEYDDNYSTSTNRTASAIRLANQAIYEASRNNPAWSNMGTTVAAVLLTGNTLSMAHAGDSRIYLIRADSIEQLTDDHSVVSEQLREGLLTKEEAEKSDMRNIITRALGIEPAVDIDLGEVALMENDRIVLCSDGLTTMVPDEVILSTVNSVDDPERACKILIDTANRNGGKDNITIILVYVSQKKWLPHFKKLFQK